MAVKDDALWHVLVDKLQRGPLRPSQVLAGLRDGIFGGDTPIWRPGLENWVPLREVREFWTPPSGPERQAASEGEGPPTPDQAFDPKKQLDEKWSLWGAATGGLVISSVLFCLRALTTDGYRLASIGYDPSAGQLGELIGELFFVPLLFAMIAVIRNAVRRRSLRPSSASASRRVAVFFGIMIAIAVSLKIFGTLYFSRNEIISGDARADFVNSFLKGCFRTQRATAVNTSLTDTQIDSYCNCVASSVAKTLTYNQLGGSNIMENLKQAATTAAPSCQVRR
jgi:hypothetical protein